MGKTCTLGNGEIIPSEETFKKFIKTIKHEEQAELITRKLIGGINTISEEIISKRMYEDIDGPLALELLEITVKLNKIYLAVV